MYISTSSFWHQTQSLHDTLTGFFWESSSFWSHVTKYKAKGTLHNRRYFPLYLCRAAYAIPFSIPLCSNPLQFIERDAPRRQRWFRVSSVENKKKKKNNNTTKGINALSLSPAKGSGIQCSSPPFQLLKEPFSNKWNALKSGTRAITDLSFFERGKRRRRVCWMQREKLPSHLM